MKRFILSFILLLAAVTGYTVYSGAAPAAAANVTKTQNVVTQWHPKNLERHWGKHRSEFPEFKTAEEYGNAALEFFRSPPKGTLRKIRHNGDRLYYHPPTNNFGVTTKRGTPKTFFRPNKKMNYWKRQR